jgi:hypothetical protein
LRPLARQAEAVLLEPRLVNGAFEAGFSRRSSSLMASASGVLALRNS